MEFLNKSELGKKSIYSTVYDPSLLLGIERLQTRKELGLDDAMPMYGADIWNAFELSWLNSKGKPIVAVGECIFPCESKKIVESKSLKLYFNSFNASVWDGVKQVQEVIERDLSLAVGASVMVRIWNLEDAPSCLGSIGQFEGKCLDDLDIECNHYQVDSSLLQLGSAKVTEKLYSNVLRSNCLVTHQPDWATILIEYTGRQIEHASLLRYIVSFRDHHGFGEQCVERIYSDIWSCCKPDRLSVYARYTRRGGIDINPYRTSHPVAMDNLRTIRQ